MAHLRFTDVPDRPTEFLDFTSLTLDEFHQLVPPFEVAFQAHMRAWRLDGKPRTAHQFSVYQNCPLPTPEDRLFFILTSLKTYALQVVQGRLFGMRQSKAHQWSHVLLPVLLTALRTRGDAPARSLRALAQRLGVSEAAAATVVTPLEEAPALVVTLAAAPDLPLLPMTGRNGVLLQDLGFLAFTLPEVEILMPTKKPRGQELTLEQQWANQALNQRRLRIEHVNSSVKRCRIVKDRIPLWKAGIRDVVMELCCALHNFRVRLTPWQPMT
jgi:hypothetical protein